LVIEVEEKAQQFLFVGLQYFSTEQAAEISLGGQSAYSIGQSKLKAQVQTGANPGGDFLLEFYDLADTQFGLGLSYKHLDRNIRLYSERESKGLFNYSEDIMDILINYTTYDYLYVGLGRRYRGFDTLKFTDIERNQLAGVGTVFVLNYDSRDNTWLPQNGAVIRIEKEAINVRADIIQAQEVKAWAALPGGFWWKYNDVNTSEQPLYIYRAPARDFLPFGFAFNEAFSSAYTYNRLSWTKEFWGGAVLEVGLDNLRWLNELVFQEKGLGLVLHHPAAIGLVSIGYGANSKNKTLFFNLSVGF